MTGGLLRQTLTKAEGAIGVAWVHIAAGLIVGFEAEAEPVFALRQAQARNEHPAVVRRPTETAGAKQRARKAADIDVRDNGIGDARRMDQVGHADRLR